MKIACLVSSLSTKGGGVQESVRRLCQSMAAQPGTEIEVLGASDAPPEKTVPTWAGVQVHGFRTAGPRHFGYAPGLAKRLLEIAPDIVLLHGLWMHPSVVAAAWQRRTGRPLMTHPHGMLDPWAFHHHGLRKRMAGALYENAALKRAACFRALTPAEGISIRARHLSQPVCVIPNGVDLTVKNPDDPPVRPAGFPRDKRVLLYLGRLHPKKNLATLLRAWARLAATSRDSWQLVIAGWDQEGHESLLRRLAGKLGLGADVTFCGALFGPEKARAFRAAHAFVLPSLSEGLPMTVLEAWAHRLPVVMTAQCHLAEGRAWGAAIETEPDVDSLGASLSRLLALSDEERRRMGQRGYDLVRQRFDWSDVAKKTLQVCRWLLREGPRPACVLAHEPEARPLPHGLPAAPWTPHRA